MEEHGVFWGTWRYDRVYVDALRWLRNDTLAKKLHHLKSNLTA